MEHRRSDAALAVTTSPTVAFARWMIGLPIGPEGPDDGPVPMAPMGPVVSGPKSHGDETRKSTVGPKPGPHASEVRDEVRDAHALMESVESKEAVEDSLQSEQGASDEQ